MSNPLYAFPTGHANRRCGRWRAIPQRTAFSWPGGSLTYQGATDMIGRLQSVFYEIRLCARHPCRLPDCEPRRHLVRRRRRAIVAAVDHLAASAWARWTTNCSRSRIPKRRCWSSTASPFATAAASSPTKATGLKTVFTLGPASYGADLLAAIEATGSATARSLRRA